MSEIEPAPKGTAVATTKPKASFVGGGAVLAIIPQDIDQVWRLAGMAVMGGMAPESLVKNKEINDATSACAIAIMAGAELGLTPLMALRSYAVVNGRPTLWGDGLIAVVRKSGIAEYVNSGADEAKGWCESKRKDTGEVMRREFTMVQAKRAGLNTKKGPWQEYPDVMMERRAISICLTRLYADVLGGLVSQEEAMDDGPMPTNERPARIEPPDVPEDEPLVIEQQTAHQNITENITVAADAAEQADDFNADDSGVADQVVQEQPKPAGGADAPKPLTAAEKWPNANDQQRRYLGRVEDDLAEYDTTIDIVAYMDGLNPPDMTTRTYSGILKAQRLQAIRPTAEQGQSDIFQ